MKDQTPRIPGLIPDQQNIPGLTPGSQLRSGVKGSSTPSTSAYARDNIGTRGGKDPRTASLRLITKLMYFDILLGIGVFVYLFLNLDSGSGASGLRLGDWTGIMWAALFFVGVSVFGAMFFKRQTEAIEEGLG